MGNVWGGSAVVVAHLVATHSWHTTTASPTTHTSFSKFIFNPLLITLITIINMIANWTRNCLLMVNEELRSSFKCEDECSDAA